MMQSSWRLPSQRTIQTVGSLNCIPTNTKTVSYSDDFWLTLIGCDPTSGCGYLHHSFSTPLYGEVNNDGFFIVCANKVQFLSLYSKDCDVEEESMVESFMTTEVFHVCVWWVSSRFCSELIHC